MDTKTTGISFAKAKSEARFFGITFAILLGIFLFVPIAIVGAFALLGLVVTGWQFIFHGSTAISIKLQEEARRKFQIFISVAVPALLSFYFIKGVSTVTISGLFGHMFSAWYIIPIGIIAYASWVAASQLNKDHPFRGFLIASAVIFVICYFGHKGYFSEFDDYTESSTMFIDKEAAKRATETGRYFGQFIVYVFVSYGAMLLRRRWKLAPNHASARAQLNPNRWDSTNEVDEN